MNGTIVLCAAIRLRAAIRPLESIQAIQNRDVRQIGEKDREYDGVHKDGQHGCLAAHEYLLANRGES